jgi:hypothetical protein
MQRGASNSHWRVAPVGAGSDMRGNAEEDLINRIYEAAVIPDLWPDVLDRLAAYPNAMGAFFLSPVQNNA